MSKYLFTIFRIVAPTVVALMAVPVWTAFATPGELHIIKSNSANLRAGPSKKSKIISRLVQGDRVMEFQRRGHWLKVQQMGRVAPEGWVNDSLLGPEPAPPRVVPVEPQTRSEEGSGPLVAQYTSPRDVFIVGHGFFRRALRRHERQGRALEHRRRHEGEFRPHGGQPQGGAGSELRFPIPSLRSIPEGG